MAVPPEYTEALENLKAFRTKILGDLVGSRVIAGLDASHDSMVKYSEKIDGISIVPYLFGRVHEYALALKLKGLDLGVGEIRRIKAEYIGGLANYPLQPPYHVPQRMLPQVDIFSFEEITDLEFLAKGGAESLKSVILLRVSSDTFEDTPQTENALYGFYTLFPVKKYSGKYKFVSPIGTFITYNRFEGERTVLWLEVYKKGTYDKCIFAMDVWLDTVARDSTDKELTIPVMWEPSTTSPEVEGQFSVVGRHIPIATLGVWATGAFEVKQTEGFPAPMGVLKIATSHETDGVVEEEVWSAHYPVTVAVNDKTMGYTEPPAGTKEDVKAITGYTVKGYPYAGYKIDHWERNNVKVGVGNQYVYTVFRDAEIKCVFTRF